MRARWLFAVALSTLAGTAAASPPRGKLHVRRAHARQSLATFDAAAETAPSYRYANLSKEACLAELTERHIEHIVVHEAPGVLAPVRLPNGVGGVRYHTRLPVSERATSPWEVFDCRLVLALDEFSKIVVAHGYDEAITYSGWRPPNKGWPKDKLAVRHPGGLAVDIKELRKSTAPNNDETLDVMKDYQGAIGSPSCGPSAKSPRPESPNSSQLRAIFCEAVSARMFTSMLSPNHDRAHHNHFHLEVTPHVTWRLIR